jgi:hypothetical protein
MNLIVEFNPDSANIAEAVIYLIEGEIIRHGSYSPSPEYPAACWRETEIPLSGAAGRFIFNTFLFKNDF